MMLIIAQLLLAIDLKESMVDERKQAAKNMVAVALQTIDDSYQSYINNELTLEQAQHQALHRMRLFTYGDMGYAWVHDVNGVMLAHPAQPALEGQNMLNSTKSYVNQLFNRFLQFIQREKQGFIKYKWTKGSTGELEDKTSYLSAYQPWQWTVGTGVYQQDIEEEFSDKLLSIILTSSVFILVLIFVCYVISLNILKPLHKLTKTMVKISSEKDLTIDMKAQGKDELSVLGSAFNEMTNSLRKVVHQISTSIDTLATQAEETATVTCQISAGVKQQKHETHDAAKALAHLAELSVDMNDQVSRALSSTDDVKNAALRGQGDVRSNREVISELGINVDQAVQSVSELQSSSEQIGDILNVIKQIADQTNLLALNAAIEAARAGEQGRGFAVVADEVRTLALRTQESTGSIQDIINGLQSGVSDVVNVMHACQEKAAIGQNKANSCGQAFEQITEEINQLSILTNTIFNACGQQSEEVKKVGEQIQEISIVAEQTEHGTENINQASESLSELAQELNNLAQDFSV